MHSCPAPRPPLRPARILLPLAALLSLRLAAADLFLEPFTNSTGSDRAIVGATVPNLAGYYGATATAVTNAQANVRAAAGTGDGSVGYIYCALTPTSGASSTQAIVKTGLSVPWTDALQVSWDTVASLSTVKARLLLRLSGSAQWYVSNTELTAFVASNFTTGTPDDHLKTVALTPAAAAWSYFTLSPGGALSVGAPLSSDLPAGATIDAIGLHLVNPSASFGAVMRFDTLRIATPDLARSSAHSLQIDAAGRPRDDYFPVGFVHGTAAPTVGAGFNFRQHSSSTTTFFNGAPFASPAVMGDPHGLLYYSYASAADSLGGAVSAGYVSLPAAHDSAGAPRTGLRDKLNLFDPATVDLLHDYMEAHVNAWGVNVAHRAAGDVIDQWGLDNEWEGSPGPDYSPEARAAFAGWLDAAYSGSIADLNTAWGTAHAGFAAASAGALPAPTEFAAKPAQFLDWWTFQSEHFTGVLAGLARTMNATDPQGRRVVHKSTQQTIESTGANRARVFDPALFAELMRPISGGLYGVDDYGSGDKQAYEVNYLYHCILPLAGGPGYGVMFGETNTTAAGHVFASSIWRMLGNGLKAVNFFTLGFAGAGGDWDTYGFHEPATGAPKDKYFHAARFASTLHRAEAFWTRAVPAPGLPRVALLMPRRDVLLAPQPGNQWSWARNDRSQLYKWLREQGYWVDILPYGKIDRAFLAGYDALFLVGAEHLTAAECQEIGDYVTIDGGRLVADTRPGYFDEHHRAHDRLAPLTGVGFLSQSDNGTLTIGASHTARRPVTVQNNGATVVVTTSGGAPAAYRKIHGSGGQVLYFPFELGSASAADLVMGGWLDTALGHIGLAPAATQTYAPGKLRVEQPLVDAAGNCAVVISNRASTTHEAIPAGTLRLPLPGGPWTTALWSPAEHNGLQAVTVTPVSGDVHQVALPAFQTSGVLYLFKAHAPLLGIPQIAGTGVSVDGYGAKITPGAAFSVTVQLFNTTGATLPAGVVGLHLPGHWNASPTAVATAPLAAGASATHTFTVTPDPEHARVKPDWLHPIVARLNVGGRDLAVCTANVEAAPAPADIPYILTGNATYPATYPYRLVTGATYSYVAPASGSIADSTQLGNGNTGGLALTNGFGAANTGTRTSAVQNRASYATYQAATADVRFDLAASRLLRRVVVNLGPGAVVPTALRVLTSPDDVTYTTRHSVSLDGSSRELETPLLNVNARYVRVQVDWPANGGTLDEIEIWGR